MPSSDSEDDGRGAPLPPRGKNKDDSDDDDDARRGPMVRPGSKAAAARKPQQDESDSDSEESDGPAAVPAQRNADGSESETDSEATESENGDAGAHDDVHLWQPIDYDSMTQEDFYQLLKSKSRAARQEEKKLAQESAQKAESDQTVLEHFIDDSSKGYTYQAMLQRVFAEIRVKNPELGEGAGKQVKLPVPKTEKIGSKRTALSNFQAMCVAMNRDVEHVKDFIEKHLTTTGSIDANNCLILKLQNVKSNQIEAVFQKYVLEFCQCSNCKGIDTELSRDANNRLWNLKCRSCRASRTVQAASSATYQATTTKRSRLRNKAAL